MSAAPPSLMLEVPPLVAQSVTFLLHRVSRIVNSTSSLDEILGQIVGLAAHASGCDACLVYLTDPHGELELRASQVPRNHTLGTLRLRLGEGITGWVVWSLKKADT